ncbi:conserved hypothetical protein [Histoplasma capsulatum H143]|uniref:ATPase AAA-type core domain-containing protein n=1 Tax=Ajellomyces capsulatus (strain H143) TaxID=544712 RepID=C6H215_AJECH|nr:conserved hypothetical protein [Histoplasma capsulatum H143]
MSNKTKTVPSSLAKARLGLVPAVSLMEKAVGSTGPPGAGKAFTVEATSQNFNLPLYSIFAGDLVVAYADSTAFGQRLENIFKIVKHFDAVLLLDEGRCDHEAAQTLLGYPVIVLRPFFSENSSIILPGYPFLTTNRMIRSVDFDQAILSRVHLTTKYEGWTTEFRREVLLSRAHTAHGLPVVGLVELQQLDKFSLNGRGVKALVSNAHALAMVEEAPVTCRNLEMAAE